LKLVQKLKIWTFTVVMAVPGEKTTEENWRAAAKSYLADKVRNSSTLPERKGNNPSG
jgi:hypothetical protein